MNSFFLMMAVLLIGVFTLVLLASFIIIKEGQVYVIERLGAYYQTCGAGIHMRLPGLDRVKKKINILNETTFEINLQDEMIKYDVLFNYQVVDPKMYVYGVYDHNRAIKHYITQTIKEATIPYSNTSDLEMYVKEIIQEGMLPWGIKPLMLQLERKD